MNAANARARRRTEEQKVHQVDEGTGAGYRSEAQRRDELKEIAKHVVKQIRSAQMHKIPMLPGVAARAMEIAGRPDVAIKELESIIAPDPMITARALAIANSPLYGVGSSVKSLRNAIMRLGIDLMRDVLHQTVVEAHIFRGASEEFLRRQRVHSVGVAYLSRDIEKMMQGECSTAFLCGLMHDIGETILQQILTANMPEGLTAEEIPRISTMIHPHVGMAVAERWKLPEEIREATRRHHVYKGFAKSEGYSLVGNMICAADRLAQHVGMEEQPGSERVLDLEGCAEDREIFEDLGIPIEKAQKLLERAQAIKEQLGA